MGEVWKTLLSSAPERREEDDEDGEEDDVMEQDEEEEDAKSAEGLSRPQDLTLDDTGYKVC